MAHHAQKEFCSAVRQLFPEYFTNKRVLDVGSFDVNGNNRYLFNHCDYIGIDVGEGPNVDYICPGHEWVADYQYDVVISTECFEHDRHWKQTWDNICTRLVKPGGLFLMTCATIGRNEHGTLRSGPGDSPSTINVDDEWANYYLNLTEENIRTAIKPEEIFSWFRFYVNTVEHDLYFWGIKKTAPTRAYTALNS